MSKIKIGFSGAVINYFILFCSIASIVFLAQNFLASSQFLDGLFVSDVVTMSQTLDYINDKYVTLGSTKLYGIYWLYYIPWMTHPALSLIINLILIFFSIKFTYDIFVLNFLTSKRICLAVILNPYLYLVVTGPNKEIPMLFGTLFIIRSLIFKNKYWFIKSMLVSFLIYFIRDGYGIILLIYVILSAIPKISVNARWKIGVFISFVSSVVYLLLFSNISIFARNLLAPDSIGNESGFLGTFLTSPTNPFLSVIQLAVKMIYNWLTLALFPAFFTPNGNVYSIGYAYWFFGLLISIGVFACLFFIFSKKSKNVGERNMVLIAGFVIYILSAISVLPFIQPRYLMPVLPLALGVLMTFSKFKRRLLMTCITFFVFMFIFIYVLKGSPPATASDLVPITASFLID